MLKVSASELGTLLGCFGPQRQFSSIVSVWKKSGLVIDRFQIRKNNLHSYNHRNSILTQLHIKAEYHSLLSLSSEVKSQVQVAEVLGKGFQLLFQNSVVSSKISHGLLYLNGPSLTISERIRKETCDILGSFQRSSEDLSEKLQFLDDIIRDFNLFGLQNVLTTIKNCYGIWVGLRSNTNCSYGRNAESIYIRQYNNHMENEILQSTKVERATVSDAPTSEGRDWHLEGRLDGKLRNGHLIEIKHRVGKGLAQIPIYELLQLHAYMYITSQSQIKLIQVVRVSETQTLEDSTVVFFNHEFWSIVKLKVAKIFSFIESLSVSKIAQQCFFLLNDTQKEDLIRYNFEPLDEISEEEYQKFITLRAFE